MRHPPDFLGIGARKAATTTIDAGLRRHPSLHLPPATKEVFYFDLHFDRGLEWYLAQLGEPADGQLVGEVTPSYLTDADPARVHALNDGCRFVVSLRDPVERAWSDYCQCLRKGDISRSTSFWDAVNLRPAIIDEGRYHTALARWLELFGRERFHFVSVDRLRASAAGELAAVFTHLGVAPIEIAEPLGELNINRPVRWQAVSTLAHRTSRFLHHRGLHRAVDLAKRVGAPALLSGPRSSPDPSLQMNADDAARLRDLYAGECRGLVGLDVAFAASWLPGASET